MTTLLNLDPSQVPDDGDGLVYNAASKKWLPGRLGTVAAAEWDTPPAPLEAAPGATTLSGFAEFVMDPDGTTVHQYAHVVGAQSGIWHGESTDGETFTWDAGPALTVGTETWENTSVGVPTVFYEAGVWHMLYRGTGTGAQPMGIGYATATDPAGPFTRVKAAPSYILGGTVAGEAGPGRIIKVGSTYYLHTSTIFSDYRRTVSVYTSTDLLTWTMDPRSPVWEDGRFCNGIWRDGAYYYSLVPHYRNDGNPAGQPADIELWRSTGPQFYPEGRSFMGTVIVCGPDGTWSSNNLDTPTVLVTDITKTEYPAFTDSKPWIYYAGMNAAGHWRSGLIKLDRLPQVAMLPDAPSQEPPAPPAPPTPYTQHGLALRSNLAETSGWSGMTRVGMTSMQSFTMPKAGSIVGLSIELTASRTAGTLTAAVTDLAGGAIAGAPSITIDTGAASRAATFVPVGDCTLAALAQYRVSMSTSGWAPTGGQVLATVYIVMDAE